MSEIGESHIAPPNPSTWVDEYGDGLYRYALSRLRDGEAAEEVVQETFVAALRHVDQFAGRGTEHGWLFGILKRKIIDLIRARNRAVSIEEEDPSDALFDKSGRWRAEIRKAEKYRLASLEREDFWKAFRQCLAGLSRQHADVFTLREIDDQSAEEIGKALEITSSNVWVILYRARLKLSNCMKTQWE